VVVKPKEVAKFQKKYVSLIALARWRVVRGRLFAA